MDVGLYGKLPTHGDFLRRRISEDFLRVWDAWLQHGLTQSRAVLGDRWLDIYLTSPAWRFAFAPGVCGDAAVAGVMVPSVDRVGRYFPLTLVWHTPPSLSSLEVAIALVEVFDSAEGLLLDALATEELDFDQFDASVSDLAALIEEGAALRNPRLTPQAAVGIFPAANALSIPLHRSSDMTGAAIQLLGAQLDAGYGELGLWWTDGSAVVEPTWLLLKGLPTPTQYCAMLDGAWRAAGWDVPETTVKSEAGTGEAEWGGPVFAFSSLGVTDIGPTRENNQDAILERADVALWAVADGMGGLRNGELASRMICDVLTDMAVVPSLDEQVVIVKRQLGRVNAHLRRQATRDHDPIASGSTVVVLLIRRNTAALLWAGDSRIYRVREAAVEQMTVDHSWTADEAYSEVITRAVGGEDTFELDEIRTDVRAGDRFMLCSDGVGRVVEPATILRLMTTLPPGECCAQLIAESVRHGGTDNMSAVVVHCVLPVDRVDV